LELFIIDRHLAKYFWQTRRRDASIYEDSERAGYNERGLLTMTDRWTRKLLLRPEDKDSKIPVSPRAPVQYPSAEQLDAAFQTRYQYQSMFGAADQVRLVTINYSHDGDGYLNCNFERFRINQLIGDRTFEAISYAWGNPALTHKVLCDDCTSHISSTQSLFNVLAKLVTMPGKANGFTSGSTSRRQFWIDGLCINQLDAAERGSQVQMMANIYRRAERVHVFLGAFDNETNLLESTWFSRRWIIQEAVAAQKVALHFTKNGEWQSLNGWDALMSKALGASKDINAALLPAASVVRDISDASRTRGSGIFPLMLNFHAAQCGDDRDRLFALLGIADEYRQVPVHMAPFLALKMRFSPNYRLDTEQVYRAFALAALRSPLAFDMLHCAGAFRHPDGAGERTLPSWVPDWRCPLLYKPLMKASKFRSGIVKNARKGAIVVDEATWSIRIKGVLLGTVQELLSHSSELDKCPIELRFATVDWVTHGVGDDLSSSSIDLTADRMVVRLTNNLSAVVPIDTAIEDEVVTVIGARTPFVLRRVGDIGSCLIKHSLIGDCCVSDPKIMSGEALNKASNETDTSRSHKPILRLFDEYHIL
jgi:hypothetical protein